MSDLEREEKEIEKAYIVAGEEDFGLSVEQTESGTVEQRTRIDTHHSHKHHSKAYYKYRRIKHKIKKYFKKNKLGWVSPVLIVLLGVALIVVSVHSQSASKKQVSEESETTAAVVSTDSVDESVALKVPAFNSEQFLVNDIIADYMNPEYDSSVADSIAAITLTERLDVCKPVTLKYSVNALPAGVTITNVRILVSENSDLSKAIIINKDSADSIIKIPNLKTYTKYYYSVDVILSNETTVSTAGSFITAATPRILTVDGAVNVRDIGGWKTVNGKTVKQGLLYRGSEIDGAYQADYKATGEGVTTLINSLGVICDFDLRGNETVIPSQSPLGASVKHLQFASSSYTGIFSSEYSDEMKDIFSSFADRNNYPMYMHCTHGLDRTGTVCYILEALLGVSEQDLIKEYELSCLAYTSLRPRDRGSDFMNFVSAFNELEGANSQEKAQNYLLSIGVTQDEINSIKDIFLG